MTLQILPNEERAKNVIIVFYALMICNLLSIISGYLQYDFLVVNGEDFTEEMAEENNIRQGLFALFSLIIFIICAIFFILWFRRAYHNLHKAGVKDLQFSEGWAARSWFVPFMNLVRPYRIMEEIWDETQRVATGNYKTKDGSFIGIWWASWIIYNIFSQVSFRFSRMATHINDMMTATLIEIAADCIGIISLLFAVSLVKQVSKFEKAMYEKVYAESI